MAPGSEFHLAELDHGGEATTLLCGYVGNLQLVLNKAEAPRASEWTSYLRSSVPEGRPVTIGLASTLGGTGPNAAQRREATTYWQTQAPVPIRIVLLTDVALHRHVLAAFNLFLKVRIKTFPGGELKSALDCLGATITAGSKRELRPRSSGLSHGITRHDKFEARTFEELMPRGPTPVAGEVELPEHRASAGRTQAPANAHRAARDAAGPPTPHDTYQAALLRRPRARERASPAAGVGPRGHERRPDKRRRPRLSPRSSLQSVEAPGIEPVCAPRRNPLRDATLTNISLESQTKENPDRFHPVSSCSAVWCRVAAT